MDDEVQAAIDAHRSQFGEFDATIFGLNLSNPETKKMLLDSISKAINTGVPISDADIGVAYGDGIDI